MSSVWWWWQLYSFWLCNRNNFALLSYSTHRFSKYSSYIFIKFFYNLNFLVTTLKKISRLATDEVCLVDMSSGIIENMKTTQRNKWEKLKKGTSIPNFYRELMGNLDTSLVPLDLSSFANLEFPDQLFGPWLLGLLRFHSLKFYGI